MKNGGSAPILVIWDSQTPHRLSGYITEILQIEGYNWFSVNDLSTGPISPEDLRAHPIVILCHVDPGSDLQEAVLAYVRAGGNLIALRPPEPLAKALGLQPTVTDLVDRYMHFNRGNALNAGVEPYTVQFHGRGELYGWFGDGAQVLASFAHFRDGTTRETGTVHPAIATGPLGQGQWAVFAYDLAESTVLFHQGRRDLASTGPQPDADGDRRFKANDLFMGHLDPELCHLPQADLHQDALVRILEWMAARSQPLPRIWHFPGGARAVAFINGDGDTMSQEDLANAVATAERYGAPYTTYLMMENHPTVSPEWEKALRQRGHDFGQHTFAGHRPTPDEMRDRLREEMAAFRSRYGHESVTHRGHCVIWVGWTEMAEFLRENGVRLDTNFAVCRYFQSGYLNGSGLPVKFMDGGGSLLDIYEQSTMSTDDGWTTGKFLRPPFDVEECISRSAQQADACIDRFHTVYHPYFHPRRLRAGPTSTQPWLEGVLDHCRGRGFRFVNGAEWVRFNDGRRGLRLIDYVFDAGACVLEFSLEAEEAVEEAALALPNVVCGRAMAEARVDGETVGVAVQQLEGRSQVLLPADYQAGRERRWCICWGNGSD